MDHQRPINQSLKMSLTSKSNVNLKINKKVLRASIFNSTKTQKKSIKKHVLTS